MSCSERSQQFFKLSTPRDETNVSCLVAGRAVAEADNEVAIHQGHWKELDKGKARRQFAYRVASIDMFGMSPSSLQSGAIC
jgi:hypothetical protein